MNEVPKVYFSMEQKSIVWMACAPQATGSGADLFSLFHP